MNLKMDSAALSKVSLMLGIPAYGGQVGGNFAATLAVLSSKLAKYGIQHELFVLGNESLITRGRNAIANKFMASKHSHLLFLDADLEFNPDDILAMIFHQKDLIGLPYSKKQINWNRVVEAVKAGVPADKLESVSASVVVNFLNAQEDFEVMEVKEVKHIGTGLMLIAKTVFEQLAEAHPEWKYTLMPNENRYSKKDTAVAYFGVEIEEATGYYLSEDYKFCSDWRKLDGKVYICPWAVTKHLGSYMYICNIPALAANKLDL